MLIRECGTLSSWVMVATDAILMGFGAAHHSTKRRGILFSFSFFLVPDTLTQSLSTFDESKV